MKQDAAYLVWLALCVCLHVRGEEEQQEGHEQRVVCRWVCAWPCVQVRGEEEQQVGHQPAVDLGQGVEIHSLAEYGPGLGNRGVRLTFVGEKCPKTGQPRRMNITLICSPSSGERAAVPTARPCPSSHLSTTSTVLYCMCKHCGPPIAAPH